MVALDLSARYANVAHDAANSSTWSQHPFAFSPALVEFTKKLFIILERTKLRCVRLVLLKNPIGGEVTMR
jgi:hypothetical protein